MHKMETLKLTICRSAQIKKAFIDLTHTPEQETDDDLKRTNLFFLFFYPP